MRRSLVYLKRSTRTETNESKQTYLGTSLDALAGHTCGSNRDYRRSASDLEMPNSTLGRRRDKLHLHTSGSMGTMGNNPSRIDPLASIH